MDISRLRKGEIKAWVPVDDEVKVLCAYIDQPTWEELQKEATTTEVLDSKTGETRETLDKVLFRRLLGRRAVLDIQGLTDGVDGAGQPVPLAVTQANIDLLMDGWTEFRLAVMGTPLILRKMVVLQMEQEKKNS
jgi:hypothetical protein